MRRAGAAARGSGIPDRPVDHPGLRLRWRMRIAFAGGCRGDDPSNYEQRTDDATMLIRGSAAANRA